MIDKILISGQVSIGKSEMPNSEWHVGINGEALCGEWFGDIWDCGVLGEVVHVPTLQVDATTIVHNRLTLPPNIYGHLCLKCIGNLTKKVFYDRQTPYVCPDHGEALWTRDLDERSRRMFCFEGGHFVEPVFGDMTEEHISRKEAGVKPDTYDGRYLAFPTRSKRE